MKTFKPSQMFTCSDLQAFTSQVCGKEPIVIDFIDCSQIDSARLSMLLMLKQQLCLSSLNIVNASSEIIQLFDLYGVEYRRFDPC